jgi:hypothetical protein
MEQEAQLEQKAYLPLPFKSPEVKTCPYLMAGFLAGRHEVTDPWGITCCMGTSCAIYNTCIGAKKWMIKLVALVNSVLFVDVIDIHQLCFRQFLLLV